MWERTVSLSVKTAYLENLSVKAAHLENLLDSVQDSANLYNTTVVTTRHRRKSKFKISDFSCEIRFICVCSVCEL